jgi:hypothetical protein
MKILYWFTVLKLLTLDQWTCCFRPLVEEVQDGNGEGYKAEKTAYLINQKARGREEETEVPYPC